MSWTQADDHWTRPFNCDDRLLRTIGALGAPFGRDNMLMMISAQLESLTGVVAESKLREAWKAMRFKHPDIALQIHATEKKYYPVRDARDLEAWCNESFRIEKTARSSDEFFSRHHSLPGRYASLYWFPTSNQVALTAEHVRWDGRGSVLLLHELLSELENPTPLPTVFDGTEAQNLVPALDVVVSMPEKYEEKWVQRADELRFKLLDGQPSIGLQPPGDQSALPGDTIRTELVVPAKEAIALRAAARAQGISMTAAIHTSAVIETARANPNSPAKRFVSLAPYDVRKYCPEPFNGPRHAASIRVTALPLNVDARASWHDLAPVVYKIYRETWDMDKSDMMFVRVPYIEKGRALFEPMPAGTPRPPPATEPNVNSLGVLDDYVRHQYSDFVVKNIFFTFYMLSQQVYIHCWSWRGDLHISASYNESYYTPEYVAKFLKALKDNLVDNLIGKTT
ncbi:hypothetical protein N7454_003368 [Penicillium verhagenii]|nr:hypothetical protein N7454_003368 [Penicillium verhagenii]